MPARYDDDIPDALSAVDPTRPNIARVYDYWLGGKDNFAADREEAERMLAIYPLMRQLARENRLFLARSVTWLAEHGIRQFLDIGSGLPTAQNTHQVAQQVDSSCHVVYVDYDHVVISHAAALLSGDTVAAVRGDVSDLVSILNDPSVCKLIRRDEPIGVTLAMILHFFDVDAAREIVTALVNAIAPGSYVVMSVGCGDEATGGQLVREYKAGTLYNHAPAQIAEFFAGLELVGPGLTDARDWDPNLVATPAPHQGGRILAGVGRKPETRS